MFRIFNKLIRALGLLVDWIYLRLNGVDAPFLGVRLVGFPYIKKHKGSIIALSKGCVLVSRHSYNPAGLAHRVIIATLSSSAIIELGRNVSMSGGCLCAVKKIVIGCDTMLGVNSRVYDTDFHLIDPVARKKQVAVEEAANGAVVIGENVWLGADVLVLKSVVIGDGIVIGARSLVNRSLLVSGVYVGAPARLVRNL